MSAHFENTQQGSKAAGNKLGLATGFGHLREGRLSSAMACFIHVLANAEALSTVVISNIRLAQHSHWRQCKGQRDVTLRIADGQMSRPVEQLHPAHPQSTVAVVEIKAECIVFDGRSHPVEGNNLGHMLAAFAAQHPATRIDDTVGNPASLLLGLMYRLIWRARATVHSSSASGVHVVDFLERHADPQALAHVALLLEPVNLSLVRYLARPILPGQHQHAASALPPGLEKLCALHQGLKLGCHDQFLTRLFETALGRAPQQEERAHYTGELAASRITRLALIHSVCSGAEARRHLADRRKLRSAVQPMEIHPVLGDIEPRDIDLPHHAEPTVSVLIPVYEKVEYTLACLKSIADHLPEASFEVIIMDDRSPDGSAVLLQQVRNARVILNPQNLGFLRSCNNGARSARGEYLFFLNNDTQVKEGWLDELLLTFKNFPNCGLAGSKLIYPDGLLQEAGGIVWQDGSAWNLGNRKDPSLPQYNYAREVDYVSGAAIMVPAKLFHAHGGFDEIFAPAYYEDTDLALRLRAAGKSVIYQPISEVVHFEGVSSGTDVNKGVKAYQRVNQEKFLRRWSERLSAHRPNGVEPHLERDRGAKGRVLFIDACTPTPDKDSGSIDVINLMKIFVSMGWVVTFIPEDNHAHMERYTPSLQRQGIQALYHPHVQSVDEHIALHGACYDLIMSFRPMVTNRHISNLRAKCPKAKIVYNTVDLHFLRLEREFEIKRDPNLEQEAKRLREIELNLTKQADLTTVVSSNEFEILRNLGIKSVIHLPFSRHPGLRGRNFDRRSGLIFVGGFQHVPNVDAVKFFTSEIFPLVRELISGVRLNIVGSNTPPEVYELACQDIVVHGYVENVEELMSGMKVNIAPLRYGAGTKGKVAHALMNWLPTVATPVAVEGMGLEHNKHVCVAETSESFALEISRLYGDAMLWEAISVNGFDQASKVFGIDRVRKILVSEILNGHAPLQIC